MTAAVEGATAAKTVLLCRAVTFKVLTHLRGRLEACRLIEDDVDDAGDRIGTILSRGAVTQHLDTSDGTGWNLRQVRSLRAARSEQCRAVKALAIKENQRLIGR